MENPPNTTSDTAGGSSAFPANPVSSTSLDSTTATPKVSSASGGTLERPNYSTPAPTNATRLLPGLPQQQQQVVSPAQTPIAPAIYAAGGATLALPPAMRQQAVAVPLSTAATNTVPEFLYQLTKMLTDNNRSIIEWSKGRIEVHNPRLLETQVLNRYFRHSKFASFQRQLNYFGFRKIAGKGKMAPCSYVNDSTTDDLGSLLLVKRKVGYDQKPKTSKKRERPPSTEEVSGYSLNAIAPQPEASPSPALHRLAPVAPPLAKTQYQPPVAQKAIAKVAVGKGIRHGFVMPNVAPKPATPRTHVPMSPATIALSALKDNFHSSMRRMQEEEGKGNPQDHQHQGNTAQPTSQEASSSRPHSSTQQDQPRPNAYVPGSMSRDDSLIDLAMIPPVEEETDASDRFRQPSQSNDMGLFVDFPWQDPK